MLRQAAPGGTGEGHIDYQENMITKELERRLGSGGFEVGGLVGLRLALVQPACRGCGRSVSRGMWFKGRAIDCRCH